MGDAARQGIAVGSFDGVHLGHQAIIKHAARVLTFGANPFKQGALLTSPEEKKRLILDGHVEGERCRIEFLGEEVFGMTAEEFSTSTFLHGYKQKPIIYCGEDWRFGKGGVGSPEWLIARGFDVVVVPYAEVDGERVSSSRIRAAIERGEMESAARMLGRNWVLTGEVVSGKGVGRQIGYPTINIEPDERLVKLPNGVYEVRYSNLKAIMNYGIAPTMGEKAWAKPVAEVHLLEDASSAQELLQAPSPEYRAAPPSGLLAPRSLGTARIEVVRFIREERRFNSITELKAQIKEDIDGIL